MADQDLEDLHAAYRAEIAAIRASVDAMALVLWDDLDDYYDPSIDRLAREMARTVTGAQRDIGTLTDVYLSRYESTARGVVVRPAGVPAEAMTDLSIRGVDAVDVYRRTGPTVRAAIKGDGLEFAGRKGRQRLVKMAQTDLQLAKTHASRISGERRGVKYFRRELEGSKSCGLCIVASTQRYWIKDLLPIHPGCDCSVAEVYADADPGQLLEPERLEGVHASIKKTFGAYSDGAREFPDNRPPTKGELLMYRDVLVAHQHGEIGPVLGVRGQTFTGLGDI